MKFKIDQQKSSTVVQFFDAIDESATFNQIPEIQTSGLVLDLEHVDRINSFGARNWINWLRGLKSVQTTSLRRCPAIIVHLMNVLEGFKPKGALVESVFVPYYCPTCDKETNYLATRGHDYREATATSKLVVEAPKTIACATCGKNIEPGVVANRYFKFLQIA